MVRAVDERDAHALHRVARELAVRAWPPGCPCRPPGGSSAGSRRRRSCRRTRSRRGRAAARPRCGSRRTGRARRSASCSGACARASQRIVSRYGTRGGCSSIVDAEAALDALDGDLDVHLARGRRAICSPVCSSRLQRASGPPPPAAAAPSASLSSSPFVFGVTAKLITGSGKASGGSPRDLVASASTSPVATSFSFATAPMSPGPNSSTGSCSLPCSSQQLPDALLAPVRRVHERASRPCSEPENTRKRVMRPANGSASVLKTRRRRRRSTSARRRRRSSAPRCSSPPATGTPSTIRSSSACVPRFFVAEPHATGNSSPLVTAALSAARSSSRR